MEGGVLRPLKMIDTGKAPLGLAHHHRGVEAFLVEENGRHLEFDFHIDGMRLGIKGKVDELPRDIALVAVDETIEERILVIHHSGLLEAEFPGHRT